ncbi:hypothetical protein IV203_002744 [Nitzschia inconspicua]|uniref:Uncharacterized protein n=1 Tax=Nitzschia inconspicua TaxID=303405 RepID=A0A9K3L0H3_9STRA|nr:hypothetical protein IV203_002744 [Nitzschia inconspicua]
MSSETASVISTNNEIPSSTSYSHLSPLPLAMESVGPQMFTRPRTVTPVTSFAERDTNDASVESLPDFSFPIAVTSGCSLASFSSKRASVGLPSQYPSYPRSGSLSETVMEELQEFDRFLEPSISIMDASSAIDQAPFSRDRLSSLSSSASQRDDLFLLDLASDAPSAIVPSEPNNKILASLPPAPRRRGRHKRSQNHAMDRDFLSQVMKKV